MPVSAGQLLQGSARPDVRLKTEGNRATVQWRQAGGIQLALPAGAEVTEVGGYDDRWLAAGTADHASGGRRLLILEGNGEHAGELPVPRSSALVQRRPVLFASGEALLGMAWLEGDSVGTLGVRAAAWERGRWSRPVWVSRPGPGSQMGLAGSVLADGSWLLVWSAFDGEDDEIVASRRIGSEWEAPSRIGSGNHVPDITPAVTASPGGALVAWSRYDGETYRLARARFDGRGWQVQESTADRGALYPAFRSFEGGFVLVFLDARRGGWAAMGLDERGGVVRRAVAAKGSADSTPVVEPLEDGLQWRWQGGRSDASPWSAER